MAVPINPLDFVKNVLGMVDLENETSHDRRVDTTIHGRLITEKARYAQWKHEWARKISPAPQPSWKSSRLALAQSFSLCAITLMTQNDFGGNPLSSSRHRTIAYL